MFNHPDISDVIRRQHGERLIESAMRRRRIFGNRHIAVTSPRYPH
jgi:hypothetical protein